MGESYWLVSHVLVRKDDADTIERTLHRSADAAAAAARAVVRGVVEEFFDSDPETAERFAPLLVGEIEDLLDAYREWSDYGAFVEITNLSVVEEAEDG